MKLRSLSGRKAVAAAATMALVASTVGIGLLASPASAASQTIVLSCSPTTLAPPLTPDIPFVINIDGASPATAFPTGANLSLSTVSGSIVLAGQLVGGLRAQGATDLGVSQGIVPITATNTSAPSTKVNTNALQIGSPSTQPITGFVPDPDGAGPVVATANPIVIPFAGPVTYPSWVSAGVNGGTVNFTPTPTGAGFILLTTGLPIPSLGTGVLNTATGGPGPGNCTQLVGPAGPIATTNLVNAAPTFTAPVGTQVVSNAATAAIAVTANDSDSSIVGASWAVSAQPNPLAGTVSLGAAGGSGASSTATFNFTATAGYTGPASFTVSVSDGTTPSTYIINLNVVGGDAGSQGVFQVVNGGFLDLDACGFGPNNNPALDSAFTGGDNLQPPVLTGNCNFSMSPITLDGSNQISTGSFNDLTITEARGLPLAWSLTAQLSGPLTNATPYAGTNDEIAAANLVMGVPTCTTVTGLNPAPTAGSGGPLSAVQTVCSAVAGQNTGQFLADAGVTLAIPSSTYAGTYKGIINFVLA